MLFLVLVSAYFIQRSIRVHLNVSSLGSQRETAFLTCLVPCMSDKAFETEILLGKT